ncbi:MAG: hypothetical protein HRF49_09495 [bacterium]|jgi:hypothetical protein
MRCFLFLTVLAAMLVSGCGTADNERRNSLLTETVISPGEDDFADMDSGTRVDFPAGTFRSETIVLISDTLVGTEIDAAYFPEGAATVLGALILNSPVDTSFHKNITFTFVLNTAVAAGSTWKIYKYDEFELAWIEIIGIVAQADASGLLASAVMPSSGVQGYGGSFALFAEKPSDESPNVPPELSGDGISMDPETPVENEVVTFSAAVVDADGDLLNFSWDDGSEEYGVFSNQRYDGETVSVDWITTLTGPYTITLSVDDGKGLPVTVTMEITVV